MELLPAKNATYQEQTYWEQRYQEDRNTFDWFLTWEHLAQFLQPILQASNGAILVAGCGNRFLLNLLGSILSEQMYDAGFHSIINIDYASAVIETMSRRNGARPDMRWLVMDIRELQFDSGQFAFVVDKGTLDALLAGLTDLWNPPEAETRDALRYLAEAARVLGPTGTFLYITFGQPHFRRFLLLRPEYGWRLTLDKFGGEGVMEYFIYRLTKVVSTNDRIHKQAGKN